MDNGLIERLEARLEGYRAVTGPQWLLDAAAVIIPKLEADIAALRARNAGEG